MISRNDLDLAARYPELAGAQTSFARLARRGQEPVPVFLYAFDLRWLDGHDVSALRRGWEGVVAKRAGSAYRDARSRDWLKLKCEAGQALVIGGFTAPRGSRTQFGALLVGYHDGGDALRSAGKVGTGCDAQTLRSLGERMRGLATGACPFADPRSIREAHVTWIRPELVAQVAFTEWTRAGRLRHPRFTGLREDKPAAQVVREA